MQLARTCILLLALSSVAYAQPADDPEAPATVQLDADAPDTVEQIETTVDRLEARGRAIARRLPLWGIALALIAVFALLARVLAGVTWPYRPFTRSALLRGIVAQAVATVVFLVGVLLALELLEATALVGAVLGAAGVIGLALGFAFRDIIENYLASVLLAMRRPFRAGDHVVVEGREGKVVRMTMRETILMTLEGNHLRLPNALVFKSVIVNYTLNPMRQFNFVAGVGTAEDLARVQRLAIETLAAVPGVVDEPPPFVRVEELAASSVTVRFHGWIDQRAADIYKVRSEAVRGVKAALDAAGIDLPVPIQRVELHQAAEAAAEPPPRHPASPPVEDVQPDDHLERQIEADLQRSEEPNLLENDRAE